MHTCVLLIYFFCYNRSKQGKEAWKCVYTAFAILGETGTLFLEWMPLRVLRGKLPAAKAVCGQIKTLVIAGNLGLRVTHWPSVAQTGSCCRVFPVPDTQQETDWCLVFKKASQVWTF